MIEPKAWGLPLRFERRPCDIKLASKLFAHLEQDSRRFQAFHQFLKINCTQSIQEERSMFLNWVSAESVKRDFFMSGDEGVS